MTRKVLPTPIKKIHKSLLPLFVSLVVVCYLDRTALAFAALQLCNEGWFNARVYGVGSGVFYAGYVAFQIPSNLVLNRLGARAWLPCITAAWGAVATCCIFISSPASFYALRFALGVTEAGAFPALWHVCGQFYPPEYITVPYSIIEASIAISQILAAPAAAALLQLSGVAGLAGWQWLFLAEGLVTLLLAGVLAVKLPASVLAAPFLTAADKNWLLQQLDSGGGAVHASSNDGNGGPPSNSVSSQHSSKHAVATSSSISDDCSATADHVVLLREHKQLHHSSSSSSFVLHEDEQPSAPHAGSTAQHGSNLSTASGGGAAAPASKSSHVVDPGQLTAWQQIVSTFSNILILYLMVLKALKDIALDGLVYWVPLLIHALLDGTAVSLSPEHQQGAASGSGGSAAGAAGKHCGGKDSQLRAVLLTAIPFGTAAAAALLLGHSSEVRQERRLHIGLPLVVGGTCFSLLPLLLRLGSHVPAFMAVTAAVVAADATTGPFWSWVHMAAAPGTGAVSLAAVNSVGKAGGLLGPLSFGLILQLTGSYVPSILLVAAVLLLGGGLALCYWGEGRQQKKGSYQQLPVQRAAVGLRGPEADSSGSSSQELAHLRPSVPQQLRLQQHT